MSESYNQPGVNNNSTENPKDCVNINNLKETTIYRILNENQIYNGNTTKFTFYINTLTEKTPCYKKYTLTTDQRVFEPGKKEFKVVDKNGSEKTINGSDTVYVDTPLSSRISSFLGFAGKSKKARKAKKARKSRKARKARKSKK
jgi:hypothetical protein